MSSSYRPHFADQKGRVITGLDGNILIAEGSSVPSDGGSGYAPGCLFFLRGGGAGTKIYINEGTNSSCDFNVLTSPVSGVASGYKMARGVHTTVAASDTVSTGLSTVVSVTATLADDPGDDPMLASATVGDQAGTPPAGSIIIKTWKTSGTDPTPLAATTFGKKVNWIAIGT